jgi:hypothetical protein
VGRVVSVGGLGLVSHPAYQRHPAYQPHPPYQPHPA